MIKIKKPFSFCEIGRKDNQEDSLFPQSATADTRVFVLCDGMGGHARGEVASRTVADALGQFLADQIEDKKEITPELFNEGLARAYEALDAIGANDELTPGTTMTCLCINENNCLVAHIGDSRVYLVRPSLYRIKGAHYGILFQTEDHSLVNQLLKAGEITPEEALTFPQRNVITRAMQPGLENPFHADIHILTDIRRGDYFFMCSDGVLENISNRHLGAILNNPHLDDQGKFSMIKMVCDNKTFDNFSCWLIPVGEVVYTSPSKKTSLQAVESEITEIDENTEALAEEDETTEPSVELEENPEEEIPVAVVNEAESGQSDDVIEVDPLQMQPDVPKEEVTEPLDVDPVIIPTPESSQSSNKAYYVDMLLMLLLPILLLILGLEIGKHDSNKKDAASAVTASQQKQKDGANATAQQPQANADQPKDSIQPSSSPVENAPSGASASVSPNYAGYSTPKSSKSSSSRSSYYNNSYYAGSYDSYSDYQPLDNTPASEDNQDASEPEPSAVTPPTPEPVAVQPAPPVSAPAQRPQAKTSGSNVIVTSEKDKKYRENPFLKKLN